ncbi:ABC transporter ATP-binding protein [Rhizobium sp. SEMIA 4085]|uniref:Dipeptide/oligopeptide ABC transporter ATP-binding protein n=1 Tax=Rhizobium gallicum bv. gallicum R602sp TaxID=1041138 RepID=A0A0B4WVB4_9HYPH|nr:MULTISPECIES: ABC transporter ATP-binding protein [Rhizobium]AJD39444.1 dipeptide/oligopeptide ABC transporter ATP-binding protein [Rhizobium gallicum bv. gallicum R602sp]NNH30892.1 ABC transporter ATP-binding protein [Rhizobium sp. SEMIA 4085]
MTKPFFQVDRLNTWFFTRQGVMKSVRDISFDLRRGEVLGIVGESGSGKSVTGMSIMGQVDEPGRIVSGSISLDGTELTVLDFEAMRRYRGRRIAMVFQNPLMTLNPLMRVRDQMYEAIEEHENVSRKEKHNRCIEALKAVGIPSPEERLDAYPHEMSGGMRQRVVIATALLLGPDMIIADEPTTALDVTIQAQIIYHIRRQIDERGLGMIWITHDLSTLSELADRIMIMYAGAMMEIGTTEDIIGSPRHPYTRKLLDSVPSRNIPGEKLRQIPGNMPSLLSLGKGCPFASRCERATEICSEPVPATELSATHRIWCYHPFEG